MSWAHLRAIGRVSVLNATRKAVLRELVVRQRRMDFHEAVGAALASGSGCSVRTFWAVLAELEALGLVEVQRGRAVPDGAGGWVKSPNRYRVVLPVLMKLAAAGFAAIREGMERARRMLAMRRELRAARIAQVIENNECATAARYIRPREETGAENAPARAGRASPERIASAYGELWELEAALGRDHPDVRAAWELVERLEAGR